MLSKIVVDGFRFAMFDKTFYRVNSSTNLYFPLDCAMLLIAPPVYHQFVYLRISYDDYFPEDK